MVGHRRKMHSPSTQNLKGLALVLSVRAGVFAGSGRSSAKDVEGQVKGRRNCTKVSQGRCPSSSFFMPLCKAAFLGISPLV
jgi:hypothetical protein